MSELPIYFDYMATTPVDERVVSKMLQFLGQSGVFGNAASLHAYGREAAKAIEVAREQVAAGIHASPEEIVFTSGATESINLAILGAARFYQRKGRHLITMSTEHKAVLDSFRQLEKEGFGNALGATKYKRDKPMVFMARAVEPIFPGWVVPTKTIRIRAAR